MSRFDEDDRAPSLAAAAVQAVRDRAGETVAAAALTAAFAAVALVLVAVALAVPPALRAAASMSPMTVVVAASASRDDAQALGGRLRSLPGVADAAFRSKEAALAELAAAGLPTADRRNPLSDTWIVRVGPTSDKAFADGAAAVRDGAAALPSVDAVRVDAAWFARLDATSERWRTQGKPGVIAGLVLLAALQVAAWFLWARAGEAGRRAARVSAALVVAFVVAAACAAASVGIASTLVDAMPRMKPIVDAVGLNWILATVLTASIGAALAATAASSGPNRPIGFVDRDSRSG